jgi:hypothetical protein
MLTDARAVAADDTDGGAVELQEPHRDLEAGS